MKRFRKLRQLGTLVLSIALITTSIPVSATETEDVQAYTMEEGSPAETVQPEEMPEENAQWEEITDEPSQLEETADEKQPEIESEKEEEFENTADAAMQDNIVDVLVETEDTEEILSEEASTTFSSGIITISQLQLKFPDGAYWNHKASEANNPDGYTSTPCGGSGMCSYHPNSHTMAMCGSGSCGCNSYAGSIQCMGFAFKCGYDTTGINPKTGWSTTTSLSSLKAGDIIRYKNDNHSIFVTAVDGDTITYGDCNADDYHCRIRWNQTVSKSTVQATLTRVYVSPLETDESPSLNHVDVGTDFYAYLVFTAPWRELGLSDTNVQTENTEGTSDHIWYFERQSDGSYKITNASNSKCLDVAYAGGTGSNVWVYDSNDSSAQRWYITGTSGNYHLHPASATDCSLDVTGGSTDENINVQIYTTNDSAAQTFQIYHADENLGGSEITTSVDGENLTVNWTSRSYADSYHVRIFKDTNYSGTEYSQWYCTGNTITIELPEGHYYVYVDACNSLFYKQSNIIEVDIKRPTYTLNLCGYLDNKIVYNLDTYATCDVYINGTKVAEDTNEYCTTVPEGATYEINDLKATAGHVYAGVYEGSLTGTMTGNTTVRVAFRTQPTGTQTVSDGDYLIMSATGSQRVVTVAGGSADDGANIQLWSGINYEPFVFHVTYLGNGYYSIVNRSSGKSLDVLNGNTDSGTNVQQWTQNLNDWQKWVIRADSSGEWFNILSKYTALYLTAEGSADANGTNICVATGNGTSGQKWRFVPYGGDDGQTIVDGSYHIESACASGLGRVAAVNSSSGSDGANIYLWSYTGKNKEIFHVKYLGNGYYKITNEWSGYSLNASDDAVSPGTNLEENQYTGDSFCQQWIIRSCGYGYYNVICRANGLYMDLKDGISADGQNIQLYLKNGANAEKWKFIPADTSTIAVTEVASKASRGYLYKIYTTSDGSGLNWWKAKEWCEQNGGHLACITSTDENQVIANLVSAYGSNCWIGGSDKETEGTFQWITGESFSYTNWAADEPDDLDGVQDYMQMCADGTWDDTGLYINEAFIYETSCPDHGTCGEDLTWNLEGGYLFINGSGDMYDYSSEEEVPWYEYRQDITSVECSNELTYIGKNEFANCTGITEMDIPYTVTAIGDAAFLNCSGLTEIYIPTSVTAIGASAFAGCIGLMNVTITKNVTNIGTRAFAGCTGLQEMYVYSREISFGDDWYQLHGSQTITVYGYHAIREYIDSLSEENIAFEYIDPSGTCGDNLTWTLEDENLIIFGTGDMDNYSTFTDVPWSYYSHEITSISWPEEITSIGENAFFGCTGLTEITIPDSVTSIGAGAFSSCTGLTRIRLSDNLTVIGKNAFDYCRILTNIEIPAGVTSIGDYAFDGCSSLTGITIPDSVRIMGGYVFVNCTSLTSITIPEGLTVISTTEFLNCTSLREVIIPDSVRYIGTYAFYGCSSLTDITIPVSMYRIESHAFENCGKLENITIYSKEIRIASDFLSPVSGQTITIYGYNNMKEFVEQLNNPSIVFVSMEPIQITAEPVDTTVVAGNKFKFTISADGDGLSYLWQYSKDKGATWIDTTRTVNNYSATASTALDGRLFRCVVTDEEGNSVTSDAAQLAVKPAIDITGQTSDLTVNVGEKYSFKVTAVSNRSSSLSYLWQYSKNLKTWTDTTRKLNNYGTTANTAMDGMYYRCKVTDADGNVVYSEPTMLRVLSDITITSQPEDQVGTIGVKFTFRVAATGSSLTYLWQYSKDGGKTWINTSRTRNNYGTLASKALNGRMYRCVITDSDNNSVISEAGTLIVEY